MLIKILHLYYDIMNLYGEYGNVKIIERSLKEQGVEVFIDKKTLVDEIHFLNYDFIYIGCGTEKNQNIVLDDIMKYKDDIKQYIESNRVFLATGNSYEIFGRKIDDKNALGIFDYEIVRTKDRITSDIIYKSKYIDEEVVGFVNKMGDIIHNMNPLFEVEFGIGENEKNIQEGVKYKNFYGTYVSGPILVRNPNFLNFVVKTILNIKDDSFKTKNILHENEESGYRLVLDELKKRMNFK